MNIVTYKQFPKSFDGIKERLNSTMDTCKTTEQLASILNFYTPYIDAVVHFQSIRYKQVTDKMIKTHFTKLKLKFVKKKK